MSIESRHQTTANEQLQNNDDDEIIFIKEVSVANNETIQINEIQNSIMHSNPIYFFNNESQVDETSTLMDPTQIIIKKVKIILILLI